MAQAFHLLKKQQVDELIANGLRAIFLTSEATIDPDTQLTVDDLIANEAVDANGVYTAGGVALDNVVTSFDAVNNWAVINADNISLVGVDISDYQHLIIAQNSGNNANDVMVYHQDLGAQSQSGGNISIPVPTDFYKQR